MVDNSEISAWVSDEIALTRRRMGATVSDEKYLAKKRIGAWVSDEIALTRRRIGATVSDEKCLAKKG